MDARPDPDAVLELLACSCVRFCRLCLHGKWPNMYRKSLIAEIMKII